MANRGRGGAEFPIAETLICLLGFKGCRAYIKKRRRRHPGVSVVPLAPPRSEHRGRETGLR
jgi:hypothetical protein